MNKTVLIGIIIFITVIVVIIIKKIINNKKKKDKLYYQNKIRSDGEIKKQIEIQEKRAEAKNKLIVKINAASIIIPNKTNWENFETLLNQKNIQHLIHFTDKSNLDSIIQNGGLYSWDYCERNNIFIASPGGSQFSRELDMRKNLHNFVRLCFINDHPMMYIAMKDGRIKRPILLKISRDVIYWNDTKYSDINAATEREIVNIGSSFNHLNNIDFAIFRRNYFDLDYYEKMKYQAEVLVYERIPINYINNIYDFC